MTTKVDSRLLEDNDNFWKQRYNNNQLEWHIDNVNPILVKNLKALTSLKGKNSKPSKKIFIPLCGKTKDIPFLMSEGHEVFGVESVAVAIQDLGKENNLDLIFDEKQSLYYSENGLIKIFCGNLFECPIENWGPFDCIWDRGSFIALDYPFRTAYVDVMKRAVSYGTGNEFKYLLQAVRYDKKVYPGPPRAVDEVDLKNFFGSWANIHVLEEKLVGENHPMRKVTGKIESELYELTIMFSN